MPSWPLELERLEQPDPQQLVQRQRDAEAALDLALAEVGGHELVAPTGDVGVSGRSVGDVAV
jgi:hypothetical protein